MIRSHNLYYVRGLVYTADGYGSYSSVDTRLYFPSFHLALVYAQDICSDYPYAIYDITNKRVMRSGDV